MNFNKFRFSTLITCCLFLFNGFGQNAPAHLKYFGFVAIDCFYDDPQDASNLTNYINEVDSFSNLAHMCVYDYTDDIVARTNVMNSLCVNPILHIQEIFFEIVDDQGPSGVNYDLRADFTTRWNAFKAINSSVLSQSKIGCFYIMDEPYWNGVSLSEMETVCSLLKLDYPDIPILVVEAYLTVGVMEVPETVDWIGFDRYGVYDPETDVDFLNDLDTLKARISSPHQKIILIIDDQWFPEYESFYGWSQNTMADVVQNYYDLAVADTSIIGLIGYIWPGGLDGPTQLGVRNLTPPVIAKNVEIGQLIKANYSPCEVANLSEIEFSTDELSIFPNPTQSFLNIELSTITNNGTILILNASGQIEKSISNVAGKNFKISTAEFATGLYFLVIESENRLYSEKFLVD